MWHRPDEGIKLVRLVNAARRRLRPDRKQRDNARARRTLLDRLPTKSSGAEVGVWKGEFSARLLKHLRPRTLHLIDPWSFQPEIPNSWYGGASATSQQDMDTIYEGVRARFSGAIDKGVVHLHRTEAHSAAAEIDAVSLDWVYLDGDHRYEAVRDELVLYASLVKPGGIIAGDDYHGEGWWEGGVKRAADEWATERGLRLELIGSQFLTRLPE